MARVVRGTSERRTLAEERRRPRSIASSIMRGSALVAQATPRILSAGYLSDRVPVGESGGGFVLRSELKNGAIITGLGDHL
jgi:hypothetical protein